jgi:competence protein ComEA
MRRLAARCRPAAALWAPRRRNVAALGVAVLIAATATLWWVVASRPRPIPVLESGAGLAGATTTPSAGLGHASPSPSASGGRPSPGGQPSVAETGADGLVVDVAGKVARPGIYRLPAGSRVFDALLAAGGPLPGVVTTPLNLAAPLNDGQQVVVGIDGMTGQAGPSGGAVGGSGTGGSGTTVSLNSASLDQLQHLPGVGPVLAQHILDWRAQHGRFTSVDQLRDVSGIGPSKFAAIKSKVTL